MTRVLLLAAVLAALVAVLLGSGRLGHHGRGFTWDAPASTHGWSWR